MGKLFKESGRIVHISFMGQQAEYGLPHRYLQEKQSNVYKNFIDKIQNIMSQAVLSRRCDKKDGSLLLVGDDMLLHWASELVFPVP